MLNPIALALIIVLLILVFALLRRNHRVCAALNCAARDNMELRSERSCLVKEVMHFETRAKTLEAKVASMTRRPRDARGHFVPKERAAEVAAAREKLDELFATGQVTRGVPVNLKS